MLTGRRSPFHASSNRLGNETHKAAGDRGLVRLDTDIGIDAQHVDLAGGKVIAFHDWVNNRTDAYDDNGHGTHVSGIVAGTGAGNAAYTGVAPGAALVGLKVLDQNGSGSLSNVTAAVDWAVTHKDEYNIRVISATLV
jgi:serine protease AprX